MIRVNLAHKVWTVSKLRLWMMSKVKRLEMVEVISSSKSDVSSVDQSMFFYYWIKIKSKRLLAEDLIPVSVNLFCRYKHHLWLAEATRAEDSRDACHAMNLMSNVL